MSRNRVGAAWLWLLVTCGVVAVAGAWVVLVSEDPALVLAAQIVTALTTTLTIAQAIYGAFAKAATRRRRADTDGGLVLSELRSLAAVPRRVWGLGVVALADHWQLGWSFSVRLGARSPSPLEVERGGVLRALVELLAATDRTVVVIGQSGAGKTTVAELVQRFGGKSTAVVGHDDRVPVLLHLGGWDPAGADLAAWAAHQITRTSARAGRPMSASSRGVEHVLREGRVLLLLDGLDELSAPLRDEVLHALATSGVHPVVLFSQPAPEDPPEVFAGWTCDVVCLRPLSVDEVTAHLARRVRPAPGWDRVIGHVRGEPDGRLAEVLRTPLFLALADRMISTGAEPPVALGAPGATRDTIEYALLDRVISLALDADPQQGVTPTLRARRERALHSIARIQRSLGRQDVVWWDVAEAVPWWIQAPLAAVVAFVVFRLGEGVQVAAGRLLGWDTGWSRPEESLAAAVASIVFVTSATRGDGRTPGGGPPTWHRSRPVRFGVAFGLVLGLHPVGRLGAPDRDGWALVLQVLVLVALYSLMAVVIGHGIRPLLGEPGSRARLWWRSLGLLRDHLPRPSPRRAGWDSNRGKWLAAVAVGALLASPPLLALLTGQDVDMALLVPDVLRVMALTVAAMTASLGLALSFGAPVPVDRPRSARRHLGENLLFGVVSAVLWTAALVTAGMVSALQLEVIFGGEQSASGTDASLAVQATTVVVVALWTALIVGPIGALSTLGGRFLVAMVWWTGRRALPGAFFSFLEWGHRSGLLRLQGQAYSFRHSRLVDVLDARRTGRRRHRAPQVREPS